jgi:hypothetical protein
MLNELPQLFLTDDQKGTSNFVHSSTSGID